MNDTLAVAAVVLGAAGFRVIPLLPSGKTPLTLHGVKDASSDPSVIRGWWILWPTANIGIATGRGLVVLDVDEGGEEALAVLEIERGSLPVTCEVRTGGGGRHIYLSTSLDLHLRNSVGALGRGLDVRGDGGYVVAPPSVTAMPYTWVAGRELGGHTPLAPAPDWLLHLVARAPTDPAKGTPAKEWSEVVGSTVVEGARNATVTRIAGLLFRFLPAEVALDLLQLWNAARCRPPLEEAEFGKIVTSIASRELKRRRRARGE